MIEVVKVDPVQVYEFAPEAVTVELKPVHTADAVDEISIGGLDPKLTVI
jgi:hypothetical protein